MKIMFALFVVAFALAGCYSHIGVQNESMGGSYNHSDTRTPFTRVSVSHFDGRDAFWTCVRLQNQQAYNSINQAVYARQMGVGAFYVSMPTNVVQDCQMRTSGPNGGMGGLYNGASMAPGLNVFQGGSFDASRYPMQVATAPSVQVVPVQTGAYQDNGSAASNGVTLESLDRDLDAVGRMQDHQDRQIRRLQSRR